MLGSMINRRKCPVHFVFAVIGLAIVASGCASTPRSSETSVQASQATQVLPTKFLDLVRRTSQFDFQPFASPAALLADSNVVFRGLVVSVADGRVGGEPENYSIAIRVRPTERWKGGQASSSEDVYLEVPRPENVPASQYADLLPVGTELVAFAYDAKNALLTPIVDAERGRPAGAPIYSPSPQGFFLVSGGQIVSVWGDEAGPPTEDWQVTTVAELKSAALRS